MQNEPHPQTCIRDLLYANKTNKLRYESARTYLIVQLPKWSINGLSSRPEFPIPGMENGVEGPAVSCGLQQS